MRLGLLPCLLCFISLVAVAQETDVEIGALYLDAALREVRSGETKRARELIRVGLEFNSDSSDLWYALAVSWSDDRQRTGDAVSAAERAVELGTWDAVPETLGRALLSGLYNRTLQYDDAISVSDFAPGSSASEADRLALYWHRLVGLRASRQFDAYNRLLTQALDRFPSEERFAWLLIADQDAPSLEDRRRLEWYAIYGSATRHPDETGLWVPDLRDAAYLLAVASSNQTDVSWATSYLSGVAWVDSRAAVVAAADADLLSARLQSLTVASQPDVRTLLQTEGLATATIEWLSGWTGEIHSDENGDNYWDTRYFVEDGEYVGMIQDRDQDGTIDLEVEFADGAASVASILDQRAPMSLYYAQYPYVSHVVAAVEAGSETFYLRPRSLRYDSVSLDPDVGLSASGDSTLVAPRDVSVAELLRVAVRTEVEDTNGVILERRFHEARDVVNVLRDESANGQFDHLLRMVGGRPVEGVRDTDGDGYFEIAEGYQNGRLVALAVDSNADGRPEFFEQRGSTPVRDWDVNGDGVIDTQEFRWWTSNVIRAFPEL